MSGQQTTSLGFFNDKINHREHNIYRPTRHDMTLLCMTIINEEKSVKSSIFPSYDLDHRCLGHLERAESSHFSE